MLKRVIIKNFQSIKKAEVDMNHPVVVITGHTDEGKSAFLRAIKNAVFDGVGGGFFRKELDTESGKTKTTSSMSVEVETDRGKVEWLKSKTDATYVINSTDRRENCGRVIPEDVPKALGLTSVSSLGENLHYRSQFDAAFLLNDRGGKDCYRFISRLMGADVVIESVAALEKNSRELAKDVKAFEKNLEKAQEHLDKYFSVEDLQQMEVQVQGVLSDQTELSVLRVRKEFLENLILLSEEFYKITKNLKKGEEKFTRLNGLAMFVETSLEDMVVLSSHLKLLQSMKETGQLVSEMGGRLQKASWIEAFDIEELSKDLEHQETYSHHIDTLENVLQKHKEIEAIEFVKVPPVNEIEALFGSLELEQGKYASLLGIGETGAYLNTVVCEIGQKEKEIRELEKCLPVKMSSGDYCVSHGDESITVSLVGDLYVPDLKGFKIKEGCCE